MRNITLLLISGIIILLSGCKKDDSSDDTNNSSVGKITITGFQASPESVTISWSKLNGVERYYILRRTVKATDTTSNANAQTIEVVDASATSFTDNNVPATPYLEYQILGKIYTTGSYNYTEIYSNVRSFERPELKQFVFNPKDILQDAANHRLYVIGNDSGNISILDYASMSISRKISTFATLGFSSLGTFNGTEELYVPRNDGWIYIYNANTLEKIDQIKGGEKCYSVVYNNGKLFVVADSSSYYQALNVFDRATKNIITHTGFTDDLEHIALVPGSNTKLFGLGSYHLFSFEYDANGHYVSYNTASLNSSSYDYRAFDVFPDGQGFITSRTGSMYSSALAPLQNLPFGNNQYSAFTFGSPSESVFAGCSNYKHVIEYSRPGYSELHTYPCNGYPAAVFTDGADLIVLSSVYGSSYYNDKGNYFLESIPMGK